MDHETFNKLASSGWADFHTEFKIPRGVRKQLRRWVDSLKWPENHTKHDAREYHITVLDMDTYDEDFAKWAKKRAQGKELHFKSKGMEMFNDFIVVRLECPEWEDLAADWTAEADKRGLEPHTFPGGPKAHVSVGRSHDKKWPKGVPNPHIKFKTRMFNIKRNSEWHEAADVYHVSPSGNRESIEAQGIQGGLSPNQVYVWDNELDAKDYAKFNPNLDVWRVQADGLPIVHRESEFPMRGHPENHPEYDPNGTMRERMRDTNTYVTPSPIPPERIERIAGGAVETTPADDMKKWFDSFETPAPPAPSPYHEDGSQFTPYQQVPVAQGPHIDPPKQPYKPYDWAEEGWEESPMNMTAAIDTHMCPKCGEDLEGQLCGNCGYDPYATNTDYDKAKHNWYDRAWSKPEDQPFPTPYQEKPWREDHASDISLASVSAGWHGF